MVTGTRNSATQVVRKVVQRRSSPLAPSVRLTERRLGDCVVSVEGAALAAPRELG